MGKIEKGSRKLAVDQQSALLLVLGLLIVSWLKAPVEAYYAFVAGVVGKTGVFTWGNTKEHEAEAKKVGLSAGKE